jgi:hypothetical protein
LYTCLYLVNLGLTSRKACSVCDCARCHQLRDSGQRSCRRHRSNKATLMRLSGIVEAEVTVFIIDRPRRLRCARAIRYRRLVANRRSPELPGPTDDSHAFVVTRSEMCSRNMHLSHFLVITGQSIRQYIDQGVDEISRQRRDLADLLQATSLGRILLEPG